MNNAAAQSAGADDAGLSTGVLVAIVVLAILAAVAVIAIVAYMMNKKSAGDGGVHAKEVQITGAGT